MTTLHIVGLMVAEEPILDCSWKVYTLRLCSEGSRVESPTPHQNLEGGEKLS